MVSQILHREDRSLLSGLMGILDPITGLGRKKVFERTGQTTDENIRLSDKMPLTHRQETLGLSDSSSCNHRGI